MKTFPPCRTRTGAASRAAAVLAISVLSGCGASLLPKPPPAAARYTLDAAATATATRPATATAAANAPVLLVALPSAAAGYDSARMLYQRQPQQLEAFAFHEWVEPPARLLAPLLVQALQATGAYRAVLMAPSAGTGALRLETEVLRLQHDFSAQPSTVRLTLRAALIDAATRRVLATQVFDASQPAARDDPVAGVAAAQQATLRVLDQLAAACAGWTRAAQLAPVSAAR